MKFSIDNKTLIESLNVLIKAVSSKTTIEVLKGIYVEAKNDEIIFKTYNLELAITINLDAIVHEEGSFVVEAKLLNDIIRKLPSDVTTFTKNGDTLNLKCLNSDYNLNIYNEEEFPKLPEVTSDQSIKINQALFSNMIRHTNFAVSKDESKIALTGSLIDINKDELTMVSIDGYSIAKKVSSIESDKKINVIVPGKTLSEIEKIIATNFTDDLEIIVKHNYIAFIINNIKIVSKVIEGPYIDYEKVVPKEFETTIVINRKELLEAVDRAALLANSSRTYVMIMEFDNNNLTISTNSQLGKSKDEITVKNNRKLKIGLNPNYLLKGLKVIEDDNIVLSIDSNVKPFLVKPELDDTYEYYIVPVRVR